MALGVDPASSTAPTAQQIISDLLSGSDSTKNSPRGFFSFNYTKRLENSALSVIEKIWADSTIENRTRMWKRLHEFATAHGLDVATQLDWVIPLYCEHTFRESRTLPSTRLTYAKHLSAIATRLSQVVPITRMYMSGLRSLGANRPQNQAPAMWPQHVFLFARAALRVPNVGERLYTAIFFMWKTASRFDDVSRLTSSQIHKVDNSTLVIDWSNRTKSMRLNPNRSDTFVLLVNEPSLPEPVLRVIQNELPRLGQLLQHTVTWFDKWMKRVQEATAEIASKHYTAHSFKAGSVSMLAELATSGHIAPSTVSLMAKHQLNDPTSIAMTTLVYIRDPLVKAKLNESGKATSLLMWAISEAQEVEAQQAPAPELQVEQEEQVPEDPLADLLDLNQ